MNQPKRKRGRPESQRVKIALLMLLREDCSAYVCARATGIALSTIYRACKRHGISLGPIGTDKRSVSPDERSP